MPAYLVPTWLPIARLAETLSLEKSPEDWYAVSCDLEPEISVRGGFITHKGNVQRRGNMADLEIVIFPNIN